MWLLSWTIVLSWQCIFTSMIYLEPLVQLLCYLHRSTENGMRIPRAHTCVCPNAFNSSEYCLAQSVFWTQHYGSWILNSIICKVHQIYIQICILLPPILLYKGSQAVSHKLVTGLVSLVRLDYTTFRYESFVLFYIVGSTQIADCSRPNVFSFFLQMESGCHCPALKEGKRMRREFKVVYHVLLHKPTLSDLIS